MTGVSEALTAPDALTALISRLRELEAKATPGEWVVTEGSVEDGSIYVDADDTGNHPVALLMSGSPHNEDRNDAALIVEMRNGLPLLLAHLSATDNRAPVSEGAAKVRAISERLLTEMRRVARQDGWAIGVHGSMTRDLDIIATPWTDEAVDETAFVEAMRAAVERELGGAAFIGAGDDGRTAGYKRKPHGRRCWTLHSTSDQLFESDKGAHPYVDLAIVDLRAALSADNRAPVPASGPDEGDRRERLARLIFVSLNRLDPVEERIYIDYSFEESPDNGGNVTVEACRVAVKLLLENLP